MRGVRKNRYREATRTLQSGVPDNLRGCWSGLYPYASRSKYQSRAPLPPSFSSRALNVARFPIFTADQTRCRGRGPGRAAVCRADEKQIEYKSRRMRRELATTPAWVLSRGIEMAKTENRNRAGVMRARPPR